MALNSNKHKNRKLGFTLSELLLTVAIIVILLGVATAAIFSIMRNIRQRKMDDIAQEIYMVAQNEMMRVRYTGQLEAFNQLEQANGIQTLSYMPSDAAVSGSSVKLNYVSDADAAAVIDRLLPENAMDGDIKGNHWVIEYDSLSGNVFSVYYSEKVNFSVPRNAEPDMDYVNATSYPNVTYNMLRDNSDGTSNAKTRKDKTNGYIGYYGRASIAGDEAKDLDVSMFVDNAEELTLFVSYNEPVINGTVDRIQSVEMTVSDLDVTPETTWKLTASATGVGANTDFNGYTYTPAKEPVTFTKPVKNAVTNRLEYGIVLDSILPGKGFADITGMNVGDNISVHLKVITENGIIGETTVKTNSGFETKTLAKISTDPNEVTVSYGRHLQNLNDYVAEKEFDVKQTKDIFFGEILGDTASWYAKYYANEDNSKITFVPVYNQKLMNYDGQDSLISDMLIEAKDSNNNSGMFGTFEGESLANIRMLNTQINAPEGTEAVACIAGKTEKLKKLENCYVYLTDEFALSIATMPYDITKVEYVVNGGHNIGSLIGRVEGTENLSVDNCFGATSLAGDKDSTEDYAGGLIGFISAGNVSVKDSYADSYVLGYNTAGLIGGIASGQSLDIASCYAAGFTYSYGNSTGIVFGTADNAGKTEVSEAKNANLKIAHVYSVVNQVLDKTSDGVKNFITNVRKDSLASDNSVFYCGSVPDEMCQGAPRTTMDDSKFLTDLGGDFSYMGTNAVTHAYNLIDNGLRDYTYPVVLDMDYYANKKTGGEKLLNHYGDWKAEFAKGLVYYEKYADNTYGFYGSNVSLLQYDKTVVADGYAYALSEGDYESIKSNAVVSVAFDGTYTTKNLTNKDNINIEFKGDITVKDSINGDVYVIVPIDRVIDSCEKMKDASSEFFYYAIKLDDQAFYFNPYFAKTVKSVNVEKAATTDGKTLTEADLKNAQADKTKVRASIRTARQLHELSENDVYWNWDSLGIVQELDIDYTAYRGYSQVESVITKWNGGAVPNEKYENIFTQDDFSTNGLLMTFQKPIGNAANAFRAQYDGSGCQITGLYLVDQVIQKKKTMIGLFGYNDGVIKNVTLNGNHMVGDDIEASVYGFSNKNMSNSGTSVYMGALVGYNGNRGLVDNCAVTGYKAAGRIVKESDTKTSYSENVQSYQNSFLYIGGFAGSNDGTISKCTSDVPGIHVESTSAYVYGGGFTGYNNGSISNAYAFSRLYGFLDTSLNAYYAGFAGWNAGLIQRTYCATSITVGDRAEKTSFTNNNGSVRESYYVNNVDGSYSGKVYAYIDEKKSLAATEKSFEQLADPENMSISGFSRISSDDDSLLHPYNKGDENKVFPYPAIITRKGKTVSIGNWPVTADLGDVGVIYWEHEEGGSNAGWYFSTVDATENKQSTLCEEHDDGGAVDAYGYGYYFEKDSPWEIASYKYLSLGENEAKRNENAEKALSEAMPNYSFVVYTSGKEDNQLKLCGITEDDKKDLILLKADTNTELSTKKDQLSEIEYKNNKAKEEVIEGGWKKTISEKVERNPGTETTTKDGMIKEYSIITTTDTYYYTRNNPSESDPTFAAENVVVGEKENESIAYTKESKIYGVNKWDINITLFKLSSSGNYFVDENLCDKDKNKYRHYALKRVDQPKNDEKSKDIYVEITEFDKKSPERVAKTYWIFGYIDTSEKETNNGYFKEIQKNKKDDFGVTFKTTIQENDKYVTAEYKYEHNKYYVYQEKAEKIETIMEYYKWIPTKQVDSSPNGSITLKPTGVNIVDYAGEEFVINPFFGDSMAKMTNENQINISNLGKTEKAQYYIRNASQLQFINWNAVTETTNAMTGKGGKENENNVAQEAINDGFVYLKYIIKDETLDNWDYNFYWKQTHDIDGKNGYHTPIGSLFDAGDSSTTSYSADPFIAFFGGQYDGNQYEIKNLNINSGGRQMTGLFGITMGANLKNIVMYSENGDNVIENNATDSRWYSIGGIVGFAAKGESDKSSITNCAIAGYKIQDNRDKNHPGNNGGCNIGGLVGTTNMEISGCSAVTNIILDLQYSVGHNNIRVGGIAGCLRNNMSNCYSGGKIELGDKLKEAFKQYKDGNNGAGIANTSSIWIGGLSGGVYMKVDGMEKACGPSGGWSKNAGADGSPDERPAISNCYTYMEFPDTGKYLVKNVQSMSSIGEFNADFSIERGGIKFGTVVDMVNCYAFSGNLRRTEVDQNGKTKSVNITDDAKLDSTKINWTKKQNSCSAYDDNNLNERKIFIDNTGNDHSPYITYEEMSNDLQGWLGNGYGKVTVVEDDVTVNGKYSFPSSENLKGKNYPFPTILKQNKKNVDYNVHYGDWLGAGINIIENPPKLENHILTIDLFEKEGEERGKENFEFELVDIGDNGDELQVFSGDDDIVIVTSVSDRPKDNGRYEVTVTGKKPGAATVTVKKGIYEAYLNVVVSAKIKIIVPETITVYAGADQKLPQEWETTVTDETTKEDKIVTETLRAVSEVNPTKTIHGGTWSIYMQEDSDVTLRGQSEQVDKEKNDKTFVPVLKDLRINVRDEPEKEEYEIKLGYSYTFENEKKDEETPNPSEPTTPEETPDESKIEIVQFRSITLKIVKPYEVQDDAGFVSYVSKDDKVVPVASYEIGINVDETNPGPENFEDTFKDYSWTSKFYSDEEMLKETDRVNVAYNDKISFSVNPEAKDKVASMVYADLFGRKDATDERMAGQSIHVKAKINVVTTEEKSLHGWVAYGYDKSNSEEESDDSKRESERFESRSYLITIGDVEGIVENFLDFSWKSTYSIVEDSAEAIDSDGEIDRTADGDTGAESLETINPSDYVKFAVEENAIIFSACKPMTDTKNFAVVVDLYGQKIAEGDSPAKLVHLHVTIEVIDKYDTYQDRIEETTSGDSKNDQDDPEKEKSTPSSDGDSESEDDMDEGGEDVTNPGLNKDGDSNSNHTTGQDDPEEEPIEKETDPPALPPAKEPEQTELDGENHTPDNTPDNNQNAAVE